MAIGMNRETGKFISGAEHLEQSIGCLFTTPLGSRVMRRYLGVDFSIIDKPALIDSLGLWAFVLADALDRSNDKRFAIQNVQILKVDALGSVHLSVNGFDTEQGTGFSTTFDYGA